MISFPDKIADFDRKICFSFLSETPLISRGFEPYAP
jgi:hypothetical protein